MNKRLRWFDDGAPILRMVTDRFGLGRLPAHEEYYACPCCLTAHNRAAVLARVLTEEHVPAKVVGGRSLLLTCKDCNSNSGRDFDAAAGKRQDADDFARGKVNSKAHRVTAHTDGIPLRGTIQWTEEGIQIYGVPQQNDPRVMAAHFAALHAYTESGNPRPDHSFTVHTKYDEARARISWIRSAYLAAFAALGWSYIFQQIMDPYRRQLKTPAEQIIPTHIARDVQNPADLRRIMLVTEPKELRCLAVVMGEHTVFLPGPPGLRPQSCEQIVEAFSSRTNADEQMTVDFRGKEIPWPRSPTYFWDRSEA